MDANEDLGTHIPLDDRTAAQLNAGGWNLGWALKPESLDVFYRHGIRGLFVVGMRNVDDPVQAKALDAQIDKVKNHPALYAYSVVDEPGAGAFPLLGKIVSYLRKRDPAHLAYINLLPTYATAGQLGVSADPAERAKVGQPTNFAGVDTNNETVLLYREHLKQFVETVKPDVLSYDHYNLMISGDGEQYFLNLALVREAAVKAGIPLLNIIQSMGSPEMGWRTPTEHELRWLTYTSLAYGAQGISHFRYDTGFWNKSDDRVTPTPLYWAACRINRDFVSIATELQSLKSLGVYHCGKLPIGGQALPPKSDFVLDPASQEVLLGYFGKSAGQPTHVVVVNLDYKKATTTTLVGPGPMEVFQTATKSWSDTPALSRLHLNLSPGGGVLVRLKP